MAEFADFVLGSNGSGHSGAAIMTSGFMKQMILSSMFALSLATPASAELVLAGNGELVSDTTNDVTWVSDGRLLLHLADASGDRGAFVQAIIDASGGVISETPNVVNPSGVHILTQTDFAYGEGLNPWGLELTRLSWYGAQAFVNYLNSIAYHGYTNWRLPTTNPDPSISAGWPDGLEGNPAISTSEMATLFYGQLGQERGQLLSVVHNDDYLLFHDIQDFAHWSGTELLGRPEMAWYFNAYSGWLYEFGIQSGHYKDQRYGVLPVRSGAVAPDPAKLLADLAASVVDIGPGKSLSNKVELAQIYFDAGDYVSACAVLEDFQSLVGAQSGKTISADVATKLIADAVVIISALSGS